MMLHTGEVCGSKPACGPSRGFSPALPRTPQRHARLAGIVASAHPVKAPVRPESAQQQDELNRSSSHPMLPIGPQEQLSTLQVLLDRSLQQHKPRTQERHDKSPAGFQPQPTSHQQPNRLPRHLIVSTEAKAGQMAGRLTGMLRVHSCAEVSLCSVLSIFKCLKVLALTNIFLSQHKSECSFIFSLVSQEEHQSRVDRLISARRRRNDFPPPQPDAPRPPGQPYPDTEPSTSTRAPPLFKLQAWATRSNPRRGNNNTNPNTLPVQMLDFSLDMRQMWKNMAHLSCDTAMSIADTLFNQLISQLPPAGYQPRHTSHIQSGAHNTSNGMQAAGSSGSGMQATNQQPASGPGRPEASAEDWDVAPAMLCGTDLSQAVLIFAALSFVQQRLTDEGHTHALVITVSRHSQHNLRVDGRNGFLLKLQLKPIAAVKHQLNRQRTYKKLPQTTAGADMPATA